MCGQQDWEIVLSSSEIDRETQIRTEFATLRLGHRPDGLESMDLTEFMHGGPASVLSCRQCGMFFREEPQEATYQDDLYDTALLAHLYPRYLAAFREKQRQYGFLLRPGAEVLELGSHLGAFLQTAEEWGWRPTGLDIGASSSAFARRQGVSVKKLQLQDYAPHLRKPEALFIWNCFEQLEDPANILRQAHQLLVTHGLLIVRVPNAAFYRRHRQTSSKQSLALLGYNNLLGFPYLNGYTRHSLHTLLEANHFAPVASYNSSLLTPPYPEMTSRVCSEWKQAREQGSIEGPWIEVVSRRTA